MNDQSPIVDINQASLEELSNIPGIGPAIAERIIAARPYDSIDDLKRVSGIGSNSLNRLKERLVANPVTTDSPAASIETPDEPHVPASNGQSKDETGTADVIEMETAEKSEDEAEAVAAELAEDESVVELEAKSVGGEIEEAAAAEEVETGEEVGHPIAEAVEALPTAVTPGESEAEPSGEAGRPQPKPEAPPQPQRPAARPEKQPRYMTRSGVIWTVILTNLLTLIIAVAIALGVLIAANGDLRYVSPNQFAVLSRQVDGLDAQANIIQQDLEGLRGRMENLEGLSGRVNGLEDVVSAMQTEVENTANRVNELDQQITTMGEDIQVLREDSTRYQSFLEGMRNLLESLLAPLGDSNGQ